MRGISFRKGFKTKSQMTGVDWYNSAIIFSCSLNTVSEENGCCQNFISTFIRAHCRFKSHQQRKWHSDELLIPCFPTMNHFSISCATLQ